MNNTPRLDDAQSKAEDKARKHGPARWLRVLLPALLITVWLAGAAIGGPYFGKVSEVTSNDPTAYLPTSADATQVQRLLGDFKDSDSIPAVVVIASVSALTQADLAGITEGVAALRNIPGVAAEISPAIPSEDGQAVQVFVPITSDADLGETVTAIDATLRDSIPQGISVHVTGPAGFAASLGEAFAGIDGLLLGVALLAVFVILILVYRSLLLPVAVLSTSMFALCVALLTVWWLAKADIVTLSGQTQGILFILVIGAATDYSLLYVSRYREELRITQDKWEATRRALRGSFEPIIASGGTVIVGLLCLLLSDLKSNSTLGPVASIGIIFAMLSALSLLPALLFVFGRTVFWPRKPKFEPSVVAAEHGLHTTGVWVRVAKLIKRHPRRIWTVTTAVLVFGAIGVTQFSASGIPQSDLVLGSSDARDGQVVLGQHFPGGSGSPVLVVAGEGSLQDASNILLAHDDVQSVTVASSDSPSGSAVVTPDGIAELGAGPGGGASGSTGGKRPTPTVVNGEVLLQATLTNAADSDAAELTVRELRTQFESAVPSAKVGGVTATAIDTNDASIHDRNLIIPVVLVVILLILMLLLRAVIAPIILVLTTVLSFGTALGVSALVFNGLFKFPGADPAVPLYSWRCHTLEATS